jgi:hypothetical protein
MVDAQDWITALDTYDQSLAEHQDVGAQYIALAAKALGVETKTEKTGGQIDPSYLAPLTDGAASLLADVKAAPENWRTECTGQINSLAGRLQASYPGIDTGPGTAVGERVLDSMLGKARPEVDGALVRINAIAKNSALLIGTHQYPAAHQLMMNLDSEAKAFQAYENAILKSLDTVLQIVADQYHDAIAEVILKGPAAEAPAPAPAPARPPAEDEPSLADEPPQPPAPKPTPPKPSSPSRAAPDDDFDR